MTVKMGRDFSHTSLEHRIFLIRGHKVMLDSDLAALYGIPTFRLNEQMKRNIKRFPYDFMFRLTVEEIKSLRSQFAISNKKGRGGRRCVSTSHVTHHEEVRMNMSEITVKRINRIQGQGTLKAFCDVAIAESFLIKGITVVEGKNGVFVSMPREQGKDGQWYDTVVPLTRDARQELSTIVLQAFNTNEVSVAAAAQEGLPAA